MSKKLNKTIKIAVISLTAIILCFLASIAIIVNFIFTPEKLTPVVLDVANQSLNAKLDMKRVELTFFSTFPQFGLQIEKGNVISKALKDTLWEKTDSLARFNKCLVVVNPIDYLTNKKINIKRLSLEDATVYAFRDKQGNANWNITLPDTIVDQDTTKTGVPLINEISIDKVSLKRSNIIFDDRDTRIYARMDSANLDLAAQLSKTNSKLKLSFDNKNILFWQDNELLANHIRTVVSTDLEYNNNNKELTLNDTHLSINDVAFDMQGTIRRDSVLRAVDTNIKYSLHAPSLKTVLDMIPKSVVKKSEVKAQGNVLIDGQIQGKYGKGHMPLATLAIKINKASAHYKGMPYGIDNIDLDFNAFVDLMRKTPSYANLKIFKFKGAHTTIEADAVINHLLSDPDITFNVKSKIDLTALAQTFPLQDGVKLQGKINADLHSHTRLSSIKKQDFGRVQVNGNFEMKDMLLKDINKNFEFHSNATFNFVGKDNLAAILTIDKINWLSPHLSSSIQQLKANVHSTNPQDTTQIINVKCQFEANKITGNMGDSLLVFSKKTKAHVSLHPGTLNPLKPEVTMSLDTDSLFFRMNETKIGMDKGGFGIKAEKRNDSIWSPSGIIGFHQLSILTPELKLPMHFQQTKVTIKEQKVMLKGAAVKIGKSDLLATGAIFNVYDALKFHKPIKAKLDLSSNNLDGNQLINALNVDSDTITIAENDTLSSDAPMELFVIPSNIDFEFNTQLKKVTYGNMLFENVNGAVDIRNKAIHLKNLSMRGLDADMKASLVYHTSNKKKGYTGFDFKLKDVNIGKLVDFIPSLDEVVPMLRSFKGIVNFDAAAEAELDSALNIKIPSLRSAVNIKGDSLVLMDGETFAEISKMMMFKNKKRNLIDSIYVNMTIDKGNVTVYPFVVQMDRYRAAVGGTQDLDMNFKYHISVLKSPVPFKLGVNITGNLDKMKFRVGKAKYKDMVTPVAIRKVDSTRINLGENIVRDFEKVIRRAGKK